jgi:acyl-CoA synthetase (AMP-forming)/AMP-acid ligase II
MNALQQRAATLRPRPIATPAHVRGLGAMALDKARAEPGRLILVEGGKRLTRGELVDASLRLGGALLAHGIEPGDAVAFQLPNWWEACVVNLTAALFGFRIVPLLTIYREAELRTMLPACGVRAIFVPKSFRGYDFPALAARAAHAPMAVFTVRGDPASPNDLECLVRHEAAEPRLPDPDDIKLVLFTSGSTGHPKGVMHSHATIEMMARSITEFWSIRPDDVFLVPSPIGHIGGSIYAFDFPWVADCVAMLTDSWDPPATARLIDERGITFMAGATPFLEGLIAAASAAGTNLPSLRRFICGGASVPPELVRRGLEQFPNAVVSRAYGSTEIPLACPGIRTREEAQRRADTDGQIASEVLVLSQDGGPAPEGESGEIAIRAPQMLVGYLDPADEQGAFTPDGHFMMGDLGRIVDGGFIEITGRTKDIIIRKGENISPLEIENALMRHDDVRQASVVGVPDPERGEMVVAFVIPHAGRSFDFAAMTAQLDRIGMARQKFPERLHVVDTLPLNTIGKVQKNELRALARQLAEGLSAP